MYKPLIPYHWTPLLKSAEFTNAERLVVLYLACDCKLDDLGRWVVIWNCELVSNRSGVSRGHMNSTKKKLQQTGLATRLLAADKRNGQSEEWDFTPLISTTAPQERGPE